MWTQDNYLRCDICHTYIYMDQHPDHRRACGRIEPKVDEGLKKIVKDQLDGGVEQKERQMQRALRAEQRSGYDARQRIEARADELLAKRAMESGPMAPARAESHKAHPN